MNVKIILEKIIKISKKNNIMSDLQDQFNKMLFSTNTFMFSQKITETERFFAI